MDLKAYKKAISHTLRKMDQKKIKTKIFHQN